MKTINLHLIFIILASTLFISCEENIPRNRPTFTDADLSAVDTTTEPEEKVVENDFSRPSGAIVIQTNHCACSEGKQISIGNCVSICSEKSSSSDSNKKLFFDIELTTAITGNTDFGDIAGFCGTSMEGQSAVPSCNVEFKDEKGNIKVINLVPSAGQTSFIIDVVDLAQDQTYRFSIVENTSGARSTTAQLRLSSDVITDTIGGPLALMPVNQYSCLFRVGEIDSNSGALIIADVNRFHFYFIPETRPEPLKQSSLASVNCHDLEIYGNTPINSPLLEETTGSFTVWNKMDPRFFDLDGDGAMQIHNLIEQNMALQGQALASPLNLFFELSWPSGINDGDSNPSGEQDSSDSSSAEVVNTSMGYYMTPFLDDQTFKAYCPKQAHYYSSSVLFKAMRDVVGVDTEGLYAAKQDNVCDFILIKESRLKKIWFYKEGGLHIEPTNDTVSGKQVQFYWPADESSPFIKKSHQRVYTLKASTEISCSSVPVPETSGQGSNGVRSNFPPHDKRIGCVPVLLD
jgi:hypothetical protein